MSIYTVIVSWLLGSNNIKPNDEWINLGTKFPRDELWTITSGIGKIYANRRRVSRDVVFLKGVV